MCVGVCEGSVRDEGTLEVSTAGEAVAVCGAVLNLLTREAVPGCCSTCLPTSYRMPSIEVRVRRSPAPVRATGAIGSLALSELTRVC